MGKHFSRYVTPARLPSPLTLKCRLTGKEMNMALLKLAAGFLLSLALPVTAGSPAKSGDSLQRRDVRAEPASRRSCFEPATETDNDDNEDWDDESDSEHGLDDDLLADEDFVQEDDFVGPDDGGPNDDGTKRAPEDVRPGEEIPSLPVEPGPIPPDNLRLDNDSVEPTSSSRRLNERDASGGRNTVSAGAANHK